MYDEYAANTRNKHKIPKMSWEQADKFERDKRQHEKFKEARKANREAKRNGN